MECKIIVSADSSWGRRLGLTADTEFNTKQELIDLLNQYQRSATNKKSVVNIGGITKMLTHAVSNINAGIQQDATHDSENSHVILPSQMFNAFTFKGYSQREVNEIYGAIADIAVRGLSDTFFKDERSLSEIKEQLKAEGVAEESLDEEAKKLKDGEVVDFSQLVTRIRETNDPQAKEKMMSAYREILLKKVASGEEAGLFDVLTETFSAMDLPIDNPHMFKSAVSELANKFTKEAIKIKFDGQFAVLKPGAGSQQVYEITGGNMPYKDGMEVRTRPVMGTEVVTRQRAFEWAKLNGIDINTLKPRNLKGQYVTIVDNTGKRQQLSMAAGEQLIPEARALEQAKVLINKYKQLSSLDSDHEALYKKFSKELNELGPDSDVTKLLNRYIDSIPDEKIKKEVVKSKALEKLFIYFNPEAEYFDGKGKTALNGADGKLLFLAKINTLGKVLTHELNNFMDEAARGLIPQSLHSDTLNNETGHRIEISRAEVIVDLTARDKFLVREGDDIGDINEAFFLKRLLEKAQPDGKAYYGAQRMISSGEQKILFHYGMVPAKFDDDKSSQAIWNVDTKSMDVYGTPEGGTAGKVLFSLKGETSVRNIDGNMHIFLNNREDAGDKIQSKVKNSDNFKAVQAFMQQYGKSKSVDLTVDNQESLEAERAKLAERAQAMYTSWNEYLNVIGTRIPGQHYQSFQGLKIVGFATGNKIFVPNEVTMLAGSDFDIDKMNMIYYSINKDGLIEGWHPAFNYSTRDNLKYSMQLPLPIGRKANEFMAEYVGTHAIDELVVMSDTFDPDNVKDLVWLYNELKSGKKLSQENSHIAEILEALDDKTKSVITPKGINNFTISRANAVINNPKNYPLLQKPVSMASPKLMGDMSKEGAEAKSRSKEQPSSVIYGKFDNMIGKDMIGIVASSGLKALSGLTSVYNKALMDLSVVANKLDKLAAIQAIDPGEQQLIDAKIKELNDAANIILAGIPKNFSLANVNYENTSPSVLNLIKPRFTITTKEEMDIARKWIIQNMKEGLADDAAEIDSELLSAATDNAKELILAKIRATPEFGTIYTALIAQGMPFWKIVQIMTNPATDFYMNNFDREAFRKDHKNLDNVLRIAGVIQEIGIMSVSKKLTETQIGNLKRANEAIVKQGFKVSNDKLISTEDGSEIGLNALISFSKLLKEGAEMQILGKYLGINQGIRAKAYELYSFTKTIESHLTDNYGMNFSFTRFLNSLSGDKEYANTFIKALNDATTSSFNLLYVLANATNFEKQLQGFSVTNQMLVESTYKMNGAYQLTKMLENYAIREGSTLNEDQFNEVQKYIDNTVLLQFFRNETRSNNNPETRPIFYDGDKRIELITSAGRVEFMKWVHDKFIPSIKNMTEFENNEFIRDLSYDEVRDRLFSEKVPIVRMTYDTTNALSQETKSKADNYKFNLNQLRFGYDKDSSDDTTNNIFNVLFWYNTLINKGGTGKYSWSKMQNELIMNDANHPFRRLAELEGALGKNTTLLNNGGAVFGPTNYMVNDIPFDPEILIMYHDIKNDARRNNESEEEENLRKSRYDQEDDFDDVEDKIAQALDDQDNDGDRDEWQEDFGLFSTRTFNRKGQEGTTVTLIKGKADQYSMDVMTPSIAIPYDLNNAPNELDNKIEAADSARAIREIGSRLQSLNPSVDIIYTDRRRLIKLSNEKNYNFANARAFILDGKVNINLSKASISDVVHEYAHLFLHSLKYESLEMYNNLISGAVNHERFNQIKSNYTHLQDADLNEEVFVTLFGEQMATKLKTPEAKFDAVQFAKEQIESGAIAWDGDKASPRPVLGIEWTDIRKGQADILADKPTTAAAKRLIDALDKARLNGVYEFVQGSGKIVQRYDVPIEGIEQAPKETNDNEELFLNFAEYTKGKLSELLSKDVESIFDLSPKETMNLSLEDAINLLGDAVMKNRIDNIYNSPIANVNEIAKLKQDLIALGIITEYCGG